MGSLKVMGRSGDETITWNPEDEASVEQARQKFEELKEQGYRMYSTESLDEFDEELGEILAVPPMAGGC